MIRIVAASTKYIVKYFQFIFVIYQARDKIRCRKEKKCNNRTRKNIYTKGNND
jgi:hypothetical protein